MGIMDLDFGLSSTSHIFLLKIQYFINSRPLAVIYLVQMQQLFILISIVQILFGCSFNESDNYALNIAKSDFQKGDFISCQKKLEDYTKKYPNDYKGWSFLGTVALELENDSLAEEVLSKAILLNPNDLKD